jgi:hypothetical protein
MQMSKRLLLLLLLLGLKKPKTLSAVCLWME